MHARKVDANQAEIVEALRNIGATVQPLHTVGSGVPDLLVGWCGRNILMEVKVAKGKLTPDQISWHGIWSGQVCVVHSIEEAEDALHRYANE